MKVRRFDASRLQDHLDGLLTPAEEAELHKALETRPDLRRQARELEIVTTLLRTPLDVDPPAELVPRVLAAVQAERLAARRALPPAWSRRLERVLVVAGASGLAAVVAASRSAWPTAAEGVGVLAVEGARAFGLFKTAAIDLAQWDWVLRLLLTLGRASGTVLDTSAGPLLALSLSAFAFTAVAGAALLRGGRRLRPGGLGHVHVLA